MNMAGFILLQASYNIGEIFFRAAQKIIDGMASKCLTFIPLMLFLHVVISLAKMYFGDMRFDPSAITKVIAIWICLAAYSPLVYAIYDATLWFTSLTGIDSSTDILKSLNTLSETGYLKKHTSEFSFPNVKVPFDDATSFFTWLILAVENGLAMIVRLFVERIKSMLLAFTLACGPVAFTIATIPGFGGTIGHWLRIFISTSLWGLTLSILDAIMAGFIQEFDIPTGTTLSEASAVLDVLVINGAVILMYLSVPLLTSFFIGSAASASFLRAAQGAAGSAAMMAGGAANKALNDYRQDRDKRKQQQRERQKMLESSDQTA